MRGVHAITTIIFLEQTNEGLGMYAGCNTWRRRGRLRTYAVSVPPIVHGEPRRPAPHDAVPQLRRHADAVLSLCPIYIRRVKTYLNWEILSDHDEHRVRVT